MQHEDSGCLFVLQQICSAKDESDLFHLLRSVSNFIGVTTGLHESKLWVEREKRNRIDNNNNNSNNELHYNYNRLPQQQH